VIEHAFDFLITKTIKNMNNRGIIQTGLIAFMKFTVLQLVLAITLSALAYANNARGQDILDKKVSITASHENVKSLLKKIGKQLSVTFTCNSALLSKELINVKWDSVTLTTALDQLFEFPVRYATVSNQVIIIPVVSDDPMAITVTGIIRDEQNVPLPGVNVLEKETTNGTTTDASGSYTISVSDPNTSLVFSFIGYATQEIPLNNRTTIDAVLMPDTKMLDQVIIVGYGQQSEGEVTGAVQQIRFDELKNVPVAQLTQKLQGRLVGVQIDQGTGRLGQSLNIKVRGAASLSTGTSPLYVVDGFPIAGDINNLNPNEIESITVLKDAASAALYGSRAAFGVVLITTKSAKEGQTNISLDAYTGYQVVPQKGRPDMMNGTEWAQFRKENYEDLGQPVPEQFQNPEQYGKGYDWYDAMLRTGRISDYNLSFSTSKDRFSTSIVAGYFKQQGVLLNSDYNRLSLRANSRFKIAEKITAGVNLSTTHNYGNAPSSDGQFFSGGGLLSNATITPPILNYKNADGTYPVAVTAPGVTAFPTPNWVRSIKEITNKTTDTRLLANGYLQYQPIEGLTLKTSINTDVWQTLVHNFQPSTAGRAFAAAPSQINANLLEENRRYWSWLSENTIEYARSFGDHQVEALVGYTAQKYRYDRATVSGSNYTDDRVQTINAAITKNNPTMDIQEWSLLSYLSRINYNFKHKYLLSASIRRDGSSRLGSRNRWGNFPAVSAGWVVSEEPFLQDVSSLSFLKVRASYGLTGNNNIGNYSQYSNVGNVTVNFNNTTQNGSAVTNLGNADLGWESTSQVDIGFDVGLLEDRISFSYDYYRKLTTDLLFNLQVPIASGFSNLQGNVGKIRFWGHEFSIISNNLVGKLKWNTNFNIAFTDNKVLALSSLSDELYVGQGIVTTITRVGGRIGQFYGLVQDGVYVDQSDLDGSPKYPAAQMGTIKFRDVSDDGAITFENGSTGDKDVIGNPLPKFIFGLTNNFSYDNFDLTIVATGSYGNKIAAAMEQGYANLDGVFNVLRDVEDRWRSPENPGAGKYGKTTAATSTERDQFHSRYVYDGSHLTIKNITLGYTAPIKAVRFVNKLRVYASVQQAFVFTKYKYGNPEVGVDFNGNLPGSTAQGIDYSAYPLPRTLTVGLNLNLK
jgi:TonB-linked SusC/RagA family outer membrane protein